MHGWRGLELRLGDSACEAERGGHLPPGWAQVTGGRHYPHRTPVGTVGGEALREWEKPCHHAREEVATADVSRLHRLCRHMRAPALGHGLCVTRE